jgi:HEAT repeat protein
MNAPKRPAVRSTKSAPGGTDPALPGRTTQKEAESGLEPLLPTASFGDFDEALDVARRLQAGSTASGLGERLAALRPAVVAGLPVIVAMLRDPAGTRRGSLLRLLDLLGPEAAPAVPALIDVLRDEGQSQDHFWVLEILRRIGPAAAEAVPVIGGCGYVSWRSRLSWGPEYEGVRQTLRAIGPAAYPHIRRSLLSADESVATAAACILRGYREIPDLPVAEFARVIPDVVTGARAAVVRALSELGVPSLAEHLSAVLLRPPGSGADEAAALMLRPLGRGDARPEAFEGMLSDADPLVRSAAARLVSGKVYAPSASLLLRLGELLTDPDERVRVSAAYSLRVYGLADRDEGPTPAADRAGWS